MTGAYTNANTQAQTEANGESKLEALRSLEERYDRLAGIVQDENADPQLITDLSAEADAIVEFLKGRENSTEMDKASARSEQELLQRLREKSQAVEELFGKELGRIKESLGGLKRGKKAVSAYGPPAVGMGYSEGKFVDRKK